MNSFIQYPGASIEGQLPRLTEQRKRAVDAADRD